VKTTVNNRTWTIKMLKTIFMNVVGSNINANMVANSL